MGTERVGRFSDAVSAIAITLLVLDIRPPHPSRRVAMDLLGRWPSYVGYVSCSSGSSGTPIT